MLVYINSNIWSQYNFKLKARDIENMKARGIKWRFGHLGNNPFKDMKSTHGHWRRDVRHRAIDFMFACLLADGESLSSRSR